MGKRKDIIRRGPDSPFWYENFTVDGVRFRRSTGETDEATARIKAAQALKDAQQSTPPADRKRDERREMTVDQGFGVYFDQAAAHRASAHNIARALERALEKIDGSRLTHKLTTGDIAEWVAHRRGQLATGKKTLVSPSTVNREIAYVKAAINYATEVYHLPAPEIAWHRLFLDEPDERETIIDTTQEARLFENLRPDYWPLIAFALTSGQRLSNCRQLRWKDVDFDSGLITFYTKSRKPGGKTHVVPLTKKLLALLSVEKGRHPEFVFTFVCQRTRLYGMKNAEGDLVEVKHMKGQRYPFTTSGWRRNWLDALKAADLSDVRFHDLRHTAATRVLRASGNIKIVQRLLGHASITTTGRYLRANVADIREAMEKTNEMTKPKRSKKKA